jgi:hypothetical protein
MMHPSILHKLLILTLFINRGVGHPRAIDHVPRIHAAVFTIPAISASVSAILEAIATTTAALLAAKMVCDCDEISWLKEELKELEGELEEVESQAEAEAEETESDDRSGDEDADEQDEPKTVEDILEDTTPGRETKGKTDQRIKEGGDAQANEDFDSLRPTNVYGIGYGRVGTLSDGSKVIVRTESGDGRTTLEIQHANSSRVTKIRYNN